METISIDLPEFTEIDISDNIEVHLSSSKPNEVLVSAGHNLIPGIKTEVIDGILYLENLNKCNFTRPYVNPIVEISNSNLKAITHHGFGNVISKDTLIYDQLKLIGLEGSGDFNVLVNIRSLQLGTNNIGNFYISGRVDELRANIYWSDAIFFCENLTVKTCYVGHSGSNTMHLNVSESITGSINSLGNIILHRQLPANISVEETNEGKIVFDP